MIAETSDYPGFVNYYYKKNCKQDKEYNHFNGLKTKNTMEFSFRNQFMSLRNVQFNDSPQAEYKYLLKYINMIEYDKSGIVHKYSPERYQQAHKQFWEHNFDIITSYIVDSG